MHLHEITYKVLLDYKADFELNGLMSLGPIEHKTNNRFKNMDDFESYINAIDVDYNSGDVIFTGYVYKINKPQFNAVKRSPYAKGTNYMKKIVKFHGRNCYTPTSGHCTIKCISYFNKKAYTEELLTFIRTEKYRSRVKTSARIQPF